MFTCVIVFYPDFKVLVLLLWELELTVLIPMVLAYSSSKTYCMYIHTYLHTYTYIHTYIHNSDFHYLDLTVSHLSHSPKQRIICYIKWLLCLLPVQPQPVVLEMAGRLMKYGKR